MMRGLPAVAAMLLAATPALAGAGFQRASVPDATGRPLEVTIWYPSDAAPVPHRLGPYEQAVAVDGPIAGGRLPLVLVLHGVQGSPDNHHLLALALAEAGFVVAGVNQGPDTRLAERPRHVGRVLDYLLGAWPGRDRLDPARVGLFGFSIGGFTTLVAIGGVPDLGRVAPYCAENPDRVCGLLKGLDASTPASAWTRDARVKAAVIAAPTLAFTFGPDALAAVAVPVQLWRPADDEITPHPRAAEAIFRALPVKPDYLVVPDAGHFAFVACTEAMAARAPAICRDAAAFDRPAFHRRFNAAVVSFFIARLPTAR